MNIRPLLSLVSASLLASCVCVMADPDAPGAETPKPAGPKKELPPPATKQGLTFEKDVKPLFEASCVRCHGERNPKGALRVDTLEGLMAGSDEGRVIVPGDSAKSKLVHSIARLNPKTAMPPEPRKPRPGQTASTNAPAGGPGGPGGRNQGPPPKPLTPEEVGIVRAWIDQGAK
jgi:hypothetical protein